MGPDTRQDLQIIDLLWLNNTSYRALWQFLLAHDLVGTIRWAHAPEDDPLPQLLQEPRRLKRRTDDGVWLKIVDAKLALEGRGYTGSGGLTIELQNDELCPWNDGIWHLQVADGHALAEPAPSGASADISLGSAALAALLSGSTRAHDLAHADRLRVHDPETLERAESLFGTRYRPWCPDHF